MRLDYFQLFNNVTRKPRFCKASRLSHVTLMRHVTYQVQLQRQQRYALEFEIADLAVDGLPADAESARSFGFVAPCFLEGALQIVGGHVAAIA